MNFTNLLTIAIPCFERKEYFMTALESALTQTVNCTVIVVDNCSSHDYFEKVCKEKGVIYFKNETNIGLFPNINRCYTLAQSEYVKILDDDDFLSPKYVELFLRAKELHPDIDVFYSDFVVFSSNGELANDQILPFGYLENGFKIIEYGIKYGLGFPYLTCAVRKTKAQLDLSFNEGGAGYDYFWIYSNADKLSFFGERSKLHNYRIHNAKASHKESEMIVNFLTAPYINDTVLLPKIGEQKLRKIISNNTFWGLVYLKSFGDKKELEKLINSESKFGEYFNVKLNESILLKIVFIIPKRIVRIFYMVSKKVGFTR